MDNMENIKMRDSNGDEVVMISWLVAACGELVASPPAAGR